MPLISIKDENALIMTDIGGKAANLARPVAVGLPVPDGWVF